MAFTALDTCMLDNGVKLALRMARVQAKDTFRAALPGHLGKVHGAVVAAYAEAGQFKRAVTTARQAQQLAATAGRQKMSEQIEGCVLLYQAGKPYRQAVEPSQP